jgi:hypothetical protein
MKHQLLIAFAFLLFVCNSKNGNDTKQTSYYAPVFKVLKFDKADKTFKDSIQGKLVDGLSWQDAAGEHRVLFTAKPVEMNKAGQQNAFIYAYCFSKQINGWKKKWEVKDRIMDCEVDATCEFFKGSFTITDKNANDIGEVCFLYKLSCKGDVSPDEKKLIMYEGTNKYAIRGSTIMIYDGAKEGGEKKIDASFNKADRSLLDYANTQWDKFGLKKY